MLYTRGQTFSTHGTSGTRGCFRGTPRTRNAFKRDSSSKPETDKSHLVRDQDCMEDGVGTPNQELQYGFALSSLSVVSHYHPTT
ncbi:hypothetical protein TNCV_2597781 [Trichonephila clavipes]|nr:hypothetical protein TNCV_2597781 [Trichonephila clavipes]